MSVWKFCGKNSLLVHHDDWRPSSSLLHHLLCLFHQMRKSSITLQNAHIQFDSHLRLSWKDWKFWKIFWISERDIWPRSSGINVFEKAANWNTAYSVSTNSVSKFFKMNTILEATEEIAKKKTNVVIEIFRTLTHRLIGVSGVQMQNKTKIRKFNMDGSISLFSKAVSSVIHWSDLKNDWHTFCSLEFTKAKKCDHVKELYIDRAIKVFGFPQSRPNPCWYILTRIDGMVIQIICKQLVELIISNNYSKIEFLKICKWKKCVLHGPKREWNDKMSRNLRYFLFKINGIYFEIEFSRFQLLIGRMKSSSIYWQLFNHRIRSENSFQCLNNGKKNLKVFTHEFKNWNLATDLRKFFQMHINNVHPMIIKRYLCMGNHQNERLLDIIWQRHPIRFEKAIGKSSEVIRWTFSKIAVKI